jgi:hypothetical protein
MGRECAIFWHSSARAKRKEQSVFWSASTLYALTARALKSTLFTFKDIPTVVLNLQVLFLQNLNMQNVFAMLAPLYISSNEPLRNHSIFFLF